MIKSIFVLILSIFLFSGCSNKNEYLSHDIEVSDETIYSLTQAKKISMGELVNQIEKYPIIFVGDHHNTEATHKFFENLLKQMAKQGYNLNLINEWFTPQHDTLLLDYTNNKLDAIRLKERRNWDKFTKFDWNLVEPLYETVKNSGGKLYGMNLSKEERKKISLKKFDKMSDKQKAFYDSLDLDVSAHKQLVMPYLEHCNKMPQKTKEPCAKRMYRVQVSWDTYMAQNVDKIAKKVLKTKKDKLFVFVGSMHIEQGLGVPLRFARLNNTSFVTLSNQQINEEGMSSIRVNKADYIFLYKQKIIKK